MRRFLAPILVALLVTGCSGAKQVPREAFEAESRKPMRLRHVHLVDGSAWAVAKFTVTDSTLIIQELNRVDERYEHAVVPIVLSLEDVESVESKDLRGPAFFILVGLAVTVSAIAVMVSLGNFFGNLD